MPHASIEGTASACFVGCCSVVRSRLGRMDEAQRKGTWHPSSVGASPVFVDAHVRHALSFVWHDHRGFERAHGRLWTSFRTQPAGATIAVLTSVVAAAATVGALFGSPLVAFLFSALTPSAAWMAGGGLVLAWGYKILVHQGFLH